MDLRSTQKGLTNSIKRFRVRANVRVMGSFRGAIERSFSHRISNHWQVLGGHFFRPVRLDFRKPIDHFGLLRWPSRRDRKAFSYTFSPTIQLNTSFYIGNKAFFETKTNSIRQSWSLESSSLTHAGEKLLTSSLAREFWTSLKEFQYRAGTIKQTGLERVSSVRTNQRLIHGSDGDRLPNQNQASLFVSNGKLTERFMGSPTEASGGAKPVAMAVPFHLSIPLVVQNLKSFINQSQVDSVILRDQNIESRGAGHLNVPGFQTARTLSLLRPVFSWSMTSSSLPVQNFLAGMVTENTFALVNAVNTGDAAALSKSVLRHLTISKHGLTPSRGASFTSAALTLAPKLAGAQSLTEADRRLNLSLSLSYARQEAGQLQAIVSALKELRSSQIEVRTSPAPQLPSIQQLTREVREQLERDIRIERERRGI